MNLSENKSFAHSTRNEGRLSGWTAFDLKHRQKQGLLPHHEGEAFPPTPGVCRRTIDSSRIPTKSFSSVLKSHDDFPSVKHKINPPAMTVQGKLTKRHEREVVEEKNNALTLKRLKEVHSWAENSLIEDLLGAAGNDVDMVSVLLNSMVSTRGAEESKEIERKELTPAPVDSPTQQEITDLIAEVSLADASEFDNDELKDKPAAGGNNHVCDAGNVELILGRLPSIPIEPEWEEDDVYLIHRKDAIKMMRSAARHSRAANSAFLRSVHFSAQQHSLKAREEWLAAQKLSNKAASEILSIRNRDNNMWKLDLHGLHAAEAVQALQGHLERLESQMPMSNTMSLNRTKVKNGIVRASSVKIPSSVDIGNLDKQPAPCKTRPASLQVITGVGNHSRGQAALPTAVRSFLVENRYHFDETRPGLITVRPKFRHP